MDKTTLSALISALIMTSCATPTPVSFQPVAKPKNIIMQISDAQSRYEILNSLALKCGVYLDMYGLSGNNSEFCTKFSNNISGGFLKETTAKCNILVRWYSETKATHPTIADKYFDDIYDACSIKHYPDITLTISKIKNLKALQ